MRITLESTASEPKYSVKSVIEVPYDNLTIEEVFDSIIEPALLAHGYHQNSIDDMLGNNEEEVVVEEEIEEEEKVEEATVEENVEYTEEWYLLFFNPFTTYSWD